MSKLHGLLLLSAGTAACIVVAAVAQPKAEKPGHSQFYRDFDAESMVVLCQNRFAFVKEKCETGSRGGGFKWKGQESEESFKVLSLAGDLSDEEVKQVLDALQPELVKVARACKAVLAHDPKDSIVDRPMRLLQPGLVWDGTAVIPPRMRGYYFTYKEGKVEGAVDVLAVPIVRDKKSEWLVLGAVHEVAR